MASASVDRIVRSERSVQVSENDSTTIKIDTKAEDGVPVAIIDEEVLRGKIHGS